LDVTHRDFVKLFSLHANQLSIDTPKQTVDFLVHQLNQNFSGKLHLFKKFLEALLEVESDILNPIIKDRINTWMDSNPSSISIIELQEQQFESVEMVHHTVDLKEEETDDSIEEATETTFQEEATSPITAICTGKCKKTSDRSEVYKLASSKLDDLLQLFKAKCPKTS
jgi:hypothetical protein